MPCAAHAPHGSRRTVPFRLPLAICQRSVVSSLFLACLAIYFDYVDVTAKQVVSAWYSVWPLHDIFITNIVYCYCTVYYYYVQYVKQKGKGGGGGRRAVEH